mmetsp:Transcript_1342/g.5464  ORF Transcript_1342/g.5464 Transcript_1342/m.5464 type:complete len:669 (+) Transcript_1342:51-2057(+)|eukprot:CAMPEP_0182898056 /NCGR_PEP_ID=MMETSP0034_2-20130328/27255_1 /TAXON_ID=156128 /ORGANISM="Nephroselmis pyriformis, Strain CCMP717" /LENGTH=668 /DNA_ID=CAMNT_0025032011 /DNA_START=36 /DNA_END=2045 /DNA_ORIENTATION=+
MGCGNSTAAPKEPAAVAHTSSASGVEIEFQKNSGAQGQGRSGASGGTNGGRGGQPESPGGGRDGYGTKKGSSAIIAGTSSGMGSGTGGSPALPDGESTSLSFIRATSPVPSSSHPADGRASAPVVPPIAGIQGAASNARSEGSAFGSARSFVSNPSSSRTVRETTEVQVEKAGNTTFVNQYIMIKQLGVGSYGLVRLCLNTEDNQLYAVKVIDKGALKKKNNRLGKKKDSPLDNVMREVAIMKKISNEHIVNLVEVIDDPNGTELYMIMEYVECGPVCGRDGPAISESVVLDYFRQMCMGLDYLHFNGVLHRDLKPENMLRNADGVLKLADFGVSEIFAEGGEGDTLKRTAGTPAFLAPEVCAAGPYQGRAADVWAMGICLYNMLYAKVPYFAMSVLEIYEAIKNDPLVIPPEPAISDDLKDLLLHILEKDPEKRYTLEEVMSHKWVTRGGSAPLPLAAEAGEGKVYVSQEEVGQAVREEKLAGMIAPQSGEWTEKTYEAGTYLFRQGEQGDRMFMINEGECEVLLTVLPEKPERDILDDSDEEDEAPEEDVEPQVLAVRGPGSIVGEMAIFGDGMRTASLLTRTRVKVLVITKDEVMETLRARPEAEQQLRQTIAKRKNEAIVFETHEKMRYQESHGRPSVGSMVGRRSSQFPSQSPSKREWTGMQP